MSPFERRTGLNGCTAVVVGAAQGLGEGIVRALAENGVDLALCDIEAEALLRTTKAARAQGRRVLAEITDACDAAALDAFWASVDRSFPRVDILVNVVGGVKQCAFLDSTSGDWASDTRRNFGYVVQSCQHAARRMRDRGHGGSLVNITTIEAHRAAPGFSIYAGLKAGVTNLSRSLAVELAPLGIRVNCVAPDQTPTPGLAKCVDPVTYDPPPLGCPPERLEALYEAQASNAIPLGRMGRTDDVANAVLFLASDLSSYLSGQTLHVDGGAMAAAGWMHYPNLGHRVRVPLALIDGPAYGG
jgi:NAD(P)-dependent dehydrogenase (short-subunit alcohol dehydrogenase family)